MSFLKVSHNNNTQTKNSEKKRATKKFIPTREMGPRELLKSSSPYFGRSGYWVMSRDSSRPPTSPSALNLE